MASPFGKRGLKKRAAAAALFLVSPLGVLAAAELLARVFVPPDAAAQYRIDRQRGQRETAHLFQFDPTLGWIPRPGAVAVLDAPDLHCTIHVDERGRRVTSAPKAAIAGRVLVLGDSVTFGYGVDDDQTFSAVLAARHADLAVENLGTIGYGTDQELLMLRRVLAGQTAAPPTTIVVSFFPNDLLDISRGTHASYRKPQFRLAGDGTLQVTGLPLAAPAAAIDRSEGWNAKLAARLRLYALVRPRFERLAYKLGLSPSGYSVEDQLGFFLAADAPARERAWTLWRAIMDQMLIATRAVDARLVVLIVPIRPQVDDGVRREIERRSGFTEADFILDEAERNIGEWAVRHGVAVASGLAPMRSAAADGKVYFDLDDHPNARGHQVLADVLEPFLAPAPTVESAIR